MINETALYLYAFYVLNALYALYAFYPHFKFKCLWLKIKTKAIVNFPWESTPPVTGLIVEMIIASKKEKLFY